MSSSQSIAALFEGRKLGAFQIRILVLCAVTALLDGFDGQVIAFVAEPLTQSLSISKSAFGAIFSVGMIGFVIGAASLGTLADRFGRKPLLVAATIVFGVFTLLTPHVHSYSQLLIVRFIAGLGLGGASACFIPLAVEYVPERMRATVVTILWAGYPIGGALGGFICAWLIPTFGWHSVFVVGGILPLILAVLLIPLLPESLSFLMTRKENAKRVAAIVRRLAPEVENPFDTFYKPTYANQATHGGVTQLFMQGRAGMTLLLWLALPLAFLVSSSLIAWMPTLLKDAGWSVSQASIVLGLFNVGGTVGTLCAGFLIDRFDRFVVLRAVLVCAALMIAVMQIAALPFTGMALGIVMFGVAITIGMAGLLAVAAISYPASVRSTGMGWAIAAARCGSALGPIATGVLVAWNWNIGQVLLAIALPILAALVLIEILKKVSQPVDASGIGSEVR